MARAKAKMVIDTLPPTQALHAEMVSRALPELNQHTPITQPSDNSAA